jgi:cytochrome c peroxidase
MKRALALVVGLSACEPLVDVPASFPEMPVPDDNPVTAAKVELGAALFDDPRLSRTEEVSCASCHEQEHAFADPRAVSEGVHGRTGTRNAPALVNLAWNTSFFWDGGAPTLEQQAIGPITNPLEMDMTMEEATTRLAADPEVVAMFRRAFDAPPSPGGITKALATFERTLVSGDSAWDRYEAGDEGALTDAQRRGRELFFGEGGECFHCHTGFDLTNHGFANNGTWTDDPGLARITEDPADEGRFKVPTLRNVAYTAPYMHDGSLATLEDVVAQYARGGAGHPNTDVTIRPLGLTAAEQRDLVAFLEALSDERFVGR